MTTFRALKYVFLLSVCIPTNLATGETADLTAVKSVIAALSEALARRDGKAVSALFTGDADVWVGSRLLAVGTNAIADRVIKRADWSELSPPSWTGKPFDSCPLTWG
jgi:hypothetical protein